MALVSPHRCVCGGSGLRSLGYVYEATQQKLVRLDLASSVTKKSNGKSKQVFRLIVHGTFVCIVHDAVFRIIMV